MLHACVYMIPLSKSNTLCGCTCVLVFCFISRYTVQATYKQERTVNTI